MSDLLARVRRFLSPITPGAARAFVMVAALAVILAASSILFTVHYVHATQAAQRRQGAAFEAKLCATLSALAALPPPPARPADLSRTYLQRQHDVLAELGPDVGCDRRTP